jgi:hypothetical protein
MKKSRLTIFTLQAAFVSILFLDVTSTILAQPTTKLRPETIEAFNEYEKALVEEFFTDIEKKEFPRFLLDEPESRMVVRSGEILIEKGERTPKIPGGIIHDWLGAMFIPDVKVSDVVQLLTDYDNHKEYYPEVEASSLLSRDGNTYRGFHRLRKKKVLTVVLNTTHEMTVYPTDDRFEYALSFSKIIQEVKNPGSSDEHELPVGEDSGFLWRMDAAWILEQCDDGVMVELATTSLSRDIPWGLGWMIRPFVESTPREALEDTLQATRIAVKQRVN